MPSPARHPLSTATRLQDAQRSDNSTETRFDCAYTAIRALADAALHAQGWRTSTSKPGHHQTTIGCLVYTLGVSPATVRVLDALRKQRKGCYWHNVVPNFAHTEVV